MNQNPQLSLETWQTLLRKSPSHFFPTWLVYQWMAKACEIQGNTDAAMRYRHRADSLMLHHLEQEKGSMFQQN